MANITGTHASETLNGTSSPDTISGLGGSDLIDGLVGADTILGGEGADTLRGGDNNDTIYGHSTADLNLSSGNIGATLLANVGSGAVFATGAPGDNGFLYALKKDGGQIIRINTTTGAQPTSPVIPDGKLPIGNNQASSSTAFHPTSERKAGPSASLTMAPGVAQFQDNARLPGIRPQPILSPSRRSSPFPI